MKKIKVHLDNRIFYKKPSGKEIGGIRMRLTQTTSEMELKEFALAVGENGRAFSRAVLRDGGRRGDDFLEQQLFVIDVDDGLAFGNFMDRCREYHLFPFLVYKTFSWSSQGEKYRAVFWCDTVIAHAGVVVFLNKLFVKIFPESDAACCDIARLFLGGKGILYLEPDNQVGILDMVDAYQMHEKKKDSKNFARNIKMFGKQNGIATDQAGLCIYDGDKTDIEKPERYIKIGSVVIGLGEHERRMETEKIPNSGEKLISGELRSGKSTKASEYTLLQVGNEEILSSCRMLQKFKKGDVSHEAKFALATNLIYIKGGQRLFFSCLKENESKWKFEWKRIKSRKYRPERCEHIDCPYMKTCGAYSLYGKLSKKIRKISGEERYTSLEDAQKNLTECFREALVRRERGIYLIKAQTALGKTELYCRMAAQEQKKPFMFVVPTLKLQEQVCENLRHKGVTAYKTVSCSVVARELSLDIEEDIQALYEAGYGDLVKSYIRKFMKEKKNELEEWQVQRLEDSINMASKLDGSCCVVTTHKLFFYLRESILEKYEVVIDEDILLTAIKETKRMPIREIKETRYKENFPIAYAEALDEILNMKDGETRKLERREKIKIGGTWRDFGKIYGLLDASVCYRDGENEEADLYYFTARPLPNIKMIVLSATLNARLYRDYCYGRNIVLKEVPYVKYQGQLIQFTGHSMSRRCIADIGKEKVLQAVGEYTELGMENIISFKDFDESKEIYFGKIEGFNDYAGENLAIIGTPHYAECVYKMVGAYLDYDTAGSLTRHRVERGGYSFPIMTYGNVHMQNLQLFLIESELEQAVGRARLLRNDCTVYVFSDFPLRQAQIRQDEYIMQQERA